MELWEKTLWVWATLYFLHIPWDKDWQCWRHPRQRAVMTCWKLIMHLHKNTKLCPLCSICLWIAGDGQKTRLYTGSFKAPRLSPVMTVSPKYSCNLICFVCNNRPSYLYGLCFSRLNTKQWWDKDKVAHILSLIKKERRPKSSLRQQTILVYYACACVCVFFNFCACVHHSRLVSACVLHISAK